MVSSRLKQLRDWVPILGILALLAMFLKLPEVPIFKCKMCLANDPYMPLMGAAYFSALVAAALLFPNFPSPAVARGGLIWALLLSLTLTYMYLPSWCIPCLLAHVCHVLIWTIWLTVPAQESSRSSPFKERLCFMLLVPICVVTLFSCLNLTFLIYGFKQKQHLLATTLKPGDRVPFTSKAELASGTVINFISPDCLFCKEQMAILNNTQLAHRLIVVSPLLLPELVEQLPSANWIEDRSGELRDLFKVAGFPTLFVIGNDSKIAQVVAGVPDQLKDMPKLQ